MSLIKDLLISSKKEKNVKGIAPGIDTAIIKRRKISRKKIIFLLSVLLFVIISGVLISFYIDLYRDNQISKYASYTKTDTSSINNIQDNTRKSNGAPVAPTKERGDEKDPEVSDSLREKESVNKLPEIKKNNIKKETLKQSLQKKEKIPVIKESKDETLKTEDQKTIESQNGIKRTSLLYKARGCEEKGDYTGAIEIYKMILLLKPDDYKVMNQIGYLYLKMGIPEKAIEHFKESLKYKNDHIPTIVNLSIAYTKIKEYDSALSILLDALKKNPSQRTIIYNIGLLYERMNKKDDALQYYRRLMELNDPRGRDGVIRLTEN